MRLTVAKKIAPVKAIIFEDRTGKQPKKGDGNDEFIVNGYAIHDSWQITWPQTIARAWDIESRLKKNNISIDYNGLAKRIPDALKNLIDDVISSTNDEFPNDPLKRLVKEAKSRKEYSEKKTNKEKNEFLFTELLDNSNIRDLKSFYRDELETLMNEYAPTSEVASNDLRQDIIWYLKLLSHKSEMVLEALMEEGFIIDAMENPPIDSERNLSARLIVRKADQEYLVRAKRNFKDSYQYRVGRTNRVGFNLKDIIQESQKANPPSDTPKDMEPIAIDLKGYDWEDKLLYQFTGSRINGWTDVKGLQHVLVLTLPNSPEEAEHSGLAVADYEAAGRVYPFTFC